jgi:hypothetical protein
LHDPERSEREQRLVRGGRREKEGEKPLLLKKAMAAIAHSS